MSTFSEDFFLFFQSLHTWLAHRKTNRNIVNEKDKNGKIISTTEYDEETGKCFHQTILRDGKVVTIIPNRSLSLKEKILGPLMIKPALKVESVLTGVTIDIPFKSGKVGSKIISKDRTTTNSKLKKILKSKIAPEQKKQEKNKVAKEYRQSHPFKKPQDERM